jgi:hypothetical protein
VPEQKILIYVLVAVAVAGLMAWRFRRMSQVRPLKLEQLWILPAILAAGAAYALIQAPPHPQDWPWLIAATLVGAGLGWVRGSMMAITVDAETHTLFFRASPAAIVLLVALVVLRFGLRAAVVQNAGAWHVGPALITDAFILFAVGLLGVARIEMAIRARRLLAAAREAAAS